MAETKKLIIIKQVKIVNDSLKLTIITSIVLGSVLVLQVHQELNKTFLILWICVLISSIFVRGFLYFLSKKDPPNRYNLKKWVKLNFINTGLSAFSFGIVGGSTFFMTDQVAVTIIHIIIAGATAGAVTTYGPIKHLSTIFILPAIIPLITANFLFGDINHLILAVIIMLFCYTVYSTSNNLYKTFLDTLEQNNLIRNLTKDKIRMEEMAKLKSDFFASMSHEIRTPLNGIIGLVDLLISSKVDGQQKDYLETIKGSSDDLLNVINDVLDLSKIESDKLKLIPTSTSLPEFIKRMTILFSERAQNKKIELKLNADKNIPSYIKVDEHRLSQITSNLLSNAIKFTDVGSVNFSVNILEQKRDIIKLQFKVEDTGVGIPKEKQEIIFNEYDQIATTSNYLSAQAGTGLGLSIAKKLVTLMNGQIGVFSKEEQGSIFWFTIEVPVLTNVKNERFQLANKTRDKYNFNVLLVDDRDTNLKVASLMLKKLGCKVETATNGAIAINKYDANPNKFDLIIMDIQMPVMDGITATKKLRKKYPNDLVQIFGLSAQVVKNLDKTPKELGFDLYLIKPLSLVTLEASLNKIV